MPAHLVLQFLGIPQVHLDDQPVVTDRRKALALLAYLAVNAIEDPHQKYSRETLSALFWPEYTQAKAFANLRRTLWEAHQAIGESWLIAERDSLHLNMDAGIELDVARFLDLLSQGSQQADRRCASPSWLIPLNCTGATSWPDSASRTPIRSMSGPSPNPKACARNSPRR